ncbi:MAG: gliding motility-associated C-terminal domain-containing protein, partial [Bacteroidota bacterium]
IDLKNSGSTKMQMPAPSWWTPRTIFAQLTSLNALNTSDNFSPVHTYQDTGRYFVKLTIFNNQTGCSKDTTIGPLIVTDFGTAFVPTAFTPNFDGHNDFLEVKGQFLGAYQFTVYNRWGVEIFSSNSQDQTWNGQLKNGNSAPEGVYVYRLEAIGAGQELIKESGTITLIR